RKEFVIKFKEKEREVLHNYAVAFSSNAASINFGYVWLLFLRCCEFIAKKNALSFNPLFGVKVPLKVSQVRYAVEKYEQKTGEVENGREKIDEIYCDTNLTPVLEAYPALNETIGLFH
ncbi:MAG: hypothetical protein V1722_03325, partial [Candidatus Micrarchaeota archaeon]